MMYGGIESGVTRIVCDMADDNGAIDRYIINITTSFGFLTRPHEYYNNKDICI